MILLSAQGRDADSPCPQSSRGIIGTARRAGNGDGAISYNDNRLCEMCVAEGKIVAARIVDHVEPNRGDAIKFWNGAVQSLCVHCHESRKKFHEQRGYDNTIVADGMSIDRRHPVYRQSTRPTD